MSPTLLNLVSDQTTPIILGGLHYQPSHMVFIRSESEKYERNVQKILAFLKNRFDFSHEECIIDAFDFEEALKKYV